MTPSDLDLPLLPSAEQIMRREFATVRRGYDPDQVRDYLQQVSLQVETLEKGVREARMEALHRAARTTGPITPIASVAPESSPAEAIAAPAGDDVYEALAKRFAGVIAGADREATKALDEAREEATRVLEQARAEADRIRVDAQARAEEARQQGSEALAKAKEEADRILGSLAERRESLVNQMQEMQSKLLAVAQGLEVAFDDGIHEGKQETKNEAKNEAKNESGNATEPPTPPADEAGSDDAKASKSASFDDDLVDPRYEDLWVSTETQTVDIPDLATIDIDFDDETRDRD
jgi:DivIVA domain-containing protein